MKQKIEDHRPEVFVTRAQKATHRVIVHGPRQRGQQQERERKRTSGIHSAL